MLYPIIDVGSNTVKLSVLDGDRIFSPAPVFFKAVPLCLGSSVQDGVLSENAVIGLCDQIREFTSIAARLTPHPPLAFATASLRGIKNREAVLSAVARDTGVNLEIISGEEEAYYSFLGALGNRNASAGVTVDLGGGSTEILAFRKGAVLDSVSLPFGCLSLYERYFDGKNEILACRERIREELKSAPELSGNAILLSGGSAKSLIHYRNALEGKRIGLGLSRRQMERILWHYDHGKEEEREKIRSVLRDRFRLVPPAVAVFTEILAHYRKEHAVVCRSGVREGMLKAYLTEKSEKN